jgi:2-haloacid dehalogenase
MDNLNPHNTTLAFDIGGVLLDWDPRYLYRKLFNGNPEAMERFLVEIDFFNWNLQQDAGRPFAAGVAELSQRFPHYAGLIQAYPERYEESLAGTIQGSVDLLHRLKQSGYRLYGLSNWSTETFQRVRNKYVFMSWFETILLSGEVKLLKPDPRIYVIFLERIGRSACECLFIDDSKANIAVADQLGFMTIFFESPGQLERELNRRGLLQCHST